MSKPVFNIDEENDFEFSQDIRRRYVNSILKDTQNMADLDSDQIAFIMATLKDLDSTNIAKARLRASSKQNDDNNNNAAVIAGLLKSLGYKPNNNALPNNVNQAPSEIPPTINEEDLGIVEGEDVIGSGQTLTYRSFLKEMGVSEDED